MIQKNGTWTYDQKNKYITLTASGKSHNKIISLTDKEIVMVSSPGEGVPDDPAALKIFLKVKE